MTQLRNQRHAARELALKLLFQVDLGRVPVSETLEEFELDEEIGEASPQAVAYAHTLVRGTAQHLREIDRMLEAFAEDWAFDRLANVDRNVLRLASWEMLFEEGVPEQVAINEAVELAKEYSTEDSGRFVNGILGNVSRQRAAGVLRVEIVDPEEDAPEDLIEEVDDEGDDAPEPTDAAPLELSEAEEDAPLPPLGAAPHRPLRRLRIRRRRTKA